MDDIDKTEVTNGKDPQSNNDFNIKYFPQSNILTNSLNEMFPEQNYENRAVKEAKEILGDEYTSEEIKELTASFEYLITNWLEEYEKKTFSNKMLKELLQSV